MKGDSDEALFERTIWGEEIDEPFDAAKVMPGKFDMTVVYQDTMWVDGTGKAHALADMTPEWRCNIGAFLTLKCREMFALESVYDGLGVGVAAGAFLAYLASGAPPLAAVGSYQWLEGTELFRALRAMTPTLAPPAVLKAWAEAAHETWSTDPDAAITLPQDPTRRVDA